MTNDASPLLPARDSDALWIGNAEFAELSGVSARAATKAMSKCLNGGAWRGCTLKVRKSSNQDGASVGYFQVFVPSLPRALSQAWGAKHPEIFSPAKIDAAVTIGIDDAAETDHKVIRLAKWKESIIAPALSHRPRSRQRASTIKDIAARPYNDPAGKSVRVSEKTLYDWIAAYEKPEGGGLPALVRKKRSDRGKRVTINRAWGHACPFHEKKKTELEDGINEYIRSLWANGVRGWAKVAQLASSKLLEMSRAAGWEEASQAQCNLGRHAVERFADYKLVSIKEKDAKKFADQFESRIIRTHTNRAPMDIVFGDVHPIDIYLRREDGSTVTPRLIAWYDLATHRLHGTLVLLDKGKGITQAHVSAAFANMVADWGLPMRLYLDNGKEYDWTPMIRGFETLTGIVMNFKQFTAELMSPELAERMNEDSPDLPDGSPPGAIVRAKPYNAQAKPIEGAFAVLETYLSGLPGWIGGDRMKKKTHNVGKEPEPYPGNLEDFHVDFDNTLRWYHAIPQGMKTNLAGLSPNDAYKAHIDRGWKPVICHREALIYAMSEALIVKVHNKGIQVDGTWYEADELTPYRQRKVTVRYAKWAPDRVILEGVDGYSWIPRAPVFDALDKRGAIEQGRRQRVMTNLVRGLKAETHRLDIPAEIARHVDMLQEAPATPEGIEMELAPGLRKLIDDGKNMPPVPAQKTRVLQPGQFIDPKTGDVRDALKNHYQEPEKKLGGAATPPNPLDEYVARYGT